MDDRLHVDLGRQPAQPDVLKWREFDGWTPMIRIDAYPPLLLLSALGTVAFELSFIVLVLSPRLRAFAALGGLVFHNFCALFLKIPFVSLQVSYAALVEWGRVLPRLGRALFGGPLYLVYDGGCRTCRRAVASLATMNVLGGVVAGGRPGRRRAPPARPRVARPRVRRRRCAGRVRGAGGAGLGRVSRDGGAPPAALARVAVPLPVAGERRRRGGVRAASGTGMRHRPRRPPRATRRASCRGRPRSGGCSSPARWRPARASWTSPGPWPSTRRSRRSRARPPSGW
jgi:hypothetical protein